MGSPKVFEEVFDSAYDYPEVSRDSSRAGGAPGKTSAAHASYPPGLHSPTPIPSGLYDVVPNPVSATSLLQHFAVVATPRGYSLIGRVADLFSPRDVMLSALSWLGLPEDAAVRVPLISRYFTVRLETAIRDGSAQYWSWTLSEREVANLLESIPIERRPDRAQDGRIATGYFDYEVSGQAVVDKSLRHAKGRATRQPGWLEDWRRPTAEQWQSNFTWAAEQEARLLNRISQSWWVGGPGLIRQILGQSDDRVLAIEQAYAELYGGSLQDAMVWIGAAPQLLSDGGQDAFSGAAAGSIARLERLRITGDRTRLLRWAREVARRQRRVRGYGFLRDDRAPERDGSIDADVDTLLWIFATTSPDMPPRQAHVDRLVRIITDSHGDDSGGRLRQIVDKLKVACAELNPEAMVDFGDLEITDSFVAWTECLSGSDGQAEIRNYLIFAFHRNGIDVRYSLPHNRSDVASPFVLLEKAGQIEGGIGKYSLRMLEDEVDHVFQGIALQNDDWITVTWYVESPTRTMYDSRTCFGCRPGAQASTWRQFQTEITAAEYRPGTNICDFEFRYEQAGAHRVIAMITWPDTEAPGNLWGNVAFVEKTYDVADMYGRVEDQWDSFEAVDVGLLVGKIETQRLAGLGRDAADVYQHTGELLADDWQPGSTRIASLSPEDAQLRVKEPPSQEQIKYRRQWAKQYFRGELAGVAVAGSWYVAARAGGQVEAARRVTAASVGLRGIKPDVEVYAITRADYSLEGISYIDGDILRFQTMFPGDYMVIFQPDFDGANACLYPVRVFDPDDARAREDEQLARRIDFIKDEYVNGGLKYIEGRKTKMFPVKALHVEHGTGITREVHLYLGCKNDKNWKDTNDVSDSYGTYSAGYRDGSGWVLYDLSPQGVERSVFDGDTIDSSFRKYAKHNKYPKGEIYALWKPNVVHAAATQSIPFWIKTSGSDSTEDIERFWGSWALTSIVSAGLAFAGGLAGIASLGLAVPFFIYAAAATGTIASIASLDRNLRQDKLDLKVLAMDAAGLAATFVAIGVAGLARSLGRARDVSRLGGRFQKLNLGKDTLRSLKLTDDALSTFELLLLSQDCVVQVRKILVSDGDDNIKIWRIAQVIANFALAGGMYGVGMASADAPRVRDTDASATTSATGEAGANRDLTRPAPRRPVYEYVYSFDTQRFLDFVDSHAPAYGARAREIVARGNGQAADLNAELADYWDVRDVAMEGGVPADPVDFERFVDDLRRLLDDYAADPNRRYRPVHNRHQLDTIELERLTPHELAQLARQRAREYGLRGRQVDLFVDAMQAMAGQSPLSGRQARLLSGDGPQFFAHELTSFMALIATGSPTGQRRAYMEALAAVMDGIMQRALQDLNRAERDALVEWMLLFFSRPSQRQEIITILGWDIELIPRYYLHRIPIHDDAGSAGVSHRAWDIEGVPTVGPQDMFRINLDGYANRVSPLALHQTMRVALGDSGVARAWVVPMTAVPNFSKTCDFLLIVVRDDGTVGVYEAAYDVRLSATRNDGYQVPFPERWSTVRLDGRFLELQRLYDNDGLEGLARYLDNVTEQTHADFNQRPATDDGTADPQLRARMHSWEPIVEHVAFDLETNTLRVDNPYDRPNAYTAGADHTGIPSNEPWREYTLNMHDAIFEALRRGWPVREVQRQIRDQLLAQLAKLTDVLYQQCGRPGGFQLHLYGSALEPHGLSGGSDLDLRLVITRELEQAELTSVLRFAALLRQQTRSGYRGFGHANITLETADGIVVTWDQVELAYRSDEFANRPETLVMNNLLFHRDQHTYVPAVAGDELADRRYQQAWPLEDREAMLSADPDADHDPMDWYRDEVLPRRRQLSQPGDSDPLTGRELRMAWTGAAIRQHDVENWLRQYEYNSQGGPRQSDRRYDRWVDEGSGSWRFTPGDGFFKNAGRYIRITVMSRAIEAGYRPSGAVDGPSMNNWDLYEATQYLTQIAPDQPGYLSPQQARYLLELHELSFYMRSLGDHGWVRQDRMIRRQVGDAFREGLASTYPWLRDAFEDWRNRYPHRGGQVMSGWPRAVTDVVEQRLAGAHPVSRHICARINDLYEHLGEARFVENIDVWNTVADIERFLRLLQAGDNAGFEAAIREARSGD